MKRLRVADSGQGLIVFLTEALEHDNTKTLLPLPRLTTMSDFPIRFRPATMTYSDLFPSLSDEARCWIYIAERRLTEAEQTTLLEALQPFFAGWASHGRPVKGTATVLEDRFLVVAGAIAGGEISGCGIDASVHAAQEAAIVEMRDTALWVSPTGYGFERFDGEAWEAMSRPPFQDREWIADTVVEIAQEDGERTRIIFDATGLNGPLDLTLARDSHSVRIAIGADGTIQVDG